MLASIRTKGLLFNMASSYFRCKVYLFWANLVFGLQTTLAHNVDEGTWTLTVLHQQILSLYRLPIPTHPQSIFLYSVLNNWNNLAEMLEITWLIHVKYVIISSSIVFPLCFKFLSVLDIEFVYMYEDLPDGAPTPFEGGSFVFCYFLYT